MNQLILLTLLTCALALPCSALEAELQFYVKAGTETIKDLKLKKLNSEGIEALTKKRYTDAARIYSDFIQRAPQSPIGYANRGSAYNSLQRFEEASADYAKAVRLDPSLKKMIDPSKPLVDKAMSVIDEGDLDKAETLLTSAAKMNPKSAAAWNELAFIKSQKQDYPKCIELASKAIAIDGTNADALANRGGCRSGSGRYKEALADLDKAIALGRGQAESYLNRAGVNAALKKCTAAAADAAKAVSMAPSLKDAATRMLTGCGR